MTLTLDPQLASVAAQLDADRETLRAAVDLVPADRRDARPAPGAWSVAEVLEHLAVIEERSLGLLAGFTASAPVLAGDVDERATVLDMRVLADRTRRIEAPEMIRPAGMTSAEEAWARLTRSRQAMHAALAAASGKDLSGHMRTHPVLGPLTGYQWLRALGGHELRHAAQVRETGARLVATEAR